MYTIIIPEPLNVCDVGLNDMKRIPSAAAPDAKKRTRPPAINKYKARTYNPFVNDMSTPKKQKHLYSFSYKLFQAINV